MIFDVLDGRRLLSLMEKHCFAELMAQVREKCAGLDLDEICAQAESQICPQLRRYGFGKKVMNLFPDGYFNMSEMEDGTGNALRGRLWKKPGKNPEETFIYDFDSDRRIIRILQDKYIRIRMNDGLYRSGLLLESSAAGLRPCGAAMAKYGKDGLVRRLFSMSWDDEQKWCGARAEFYDEPESGRRELTALYIDRAGKIGMCAKYCHVYDQSLKVIGSECIPWKE